MVEFQNLDLILIPTRTCNLRCTYCPVKKTSRGLGEAGALMAVRKFAAAGGRSIRLTGGEPLVEWKLVKKIIEEIEGLGRRGLHLEICTNGMLLDSGKISFLRRDWITIVLSMDGAMETHVRNRLGKDGGGGAFLDLLNVLEEILKGCSYVVTQTIAPSGSGSAFDDFLYLWTLGVRSYNFLPVYYRTWKDIEIRRLEKQLLLIARFIQPHVARGAARVRNIERKGIIPLFGRSVCLDSDGRFYFTNAVLLKTLAAARPRLRLADSFDAIPESLERLSRAGRAESIIGAGLSASVTRSNRKVDRALTAFVGEIAGKNKKRASGRRSVRPERLELHLSYRCTNDCVFCSEKHRLETYRCRDVTPSEAWGALLRHREAGGNHVNFTGGEPTVHPFFLPLIEGAKTLGLRVYVGTNGVMLSRREFAARALPFIDELSLSIHGPGERIHEACTRSRGSFAALLEAARHAREIKPGIMLMANMVVTRTNFNHVIATIGLCAALGVRQMLISFPSPEGGALESYRDIVVPLDRWKGTIDAIAGAAAAKGISIRFFGFPACTLGKWKMKSNDLYFDPRITVERAAVRGGGIGMSTIITKNPRRGRRKVAACRGCSFVDLCGGVFKHYVDTFEEDEIAPL